MAADDEQCTELSNNLRAYIWLVVFSAIFIAQIAIPIGDFPVNAVFVLYFVTVTIFICERLIVLRPLPALMYIIFVIIGYLGVCRGGDMVSANALILVAVLHVPFIFDPGSSWKLKRICGYFATVFVTCSMWVAIIAIIQFALVNILKLEILSNIYRVLPDGLHQLGGYTYTAPYHGLIKANGYVFREASFLSMNMAFAIIMEAVYLRRRNVLLLLLIAMFLSFSGSGILVLISATFIPNSRKTLLVAVLAVVGVVILFQLSTKVPALALWTQRISEFQAVGSSGFSRYVAPFIVVLSHWIHDINNFLFGYGAGSYDRTVRPLSLLLGFEISGANLQKTLYEYGAVGFVALDGLFFRRIYKCELRFPLKCAMIYMWLLQLNGLVEYYIIFWIFTLWQSSQTLLRMGEGASNCSNRLTT
jgi:hypothetical protein